MSTKKVKVVSGVTKVNRIKIISSKKISKVAWLKAESLYVVLSVILGTIFALYLCGSMIIDPAQINLPYVDVKLNFLAFELFRQDIWHWPLWYTNRILYPVGTNLSPPLLYIILKSISHFLPKVFVYIGYLALINSSLQFYIGFCIFRSLRNDNILAILGGLFLLCASFFAWRFFRHFDLTFQWLILLAIFLTIKRQYINYKLNFYYFLVLLFITTGLAHPYIAFMVYGIGIGFIFKLVYEKFGTIKFSPLLLMIAALSIIFLFGLYCFGYFDMGNTQAAGFGLYKSCLLGFFYPQFDTFFITYTNPVVTYKYLDPGMDYYEGECYLGGGIILLIGSALCIYPKLVKKSLLDHKYTMFMVMLVGMFLFSLSTSIYVTPYISLINFLVPDISFIKILCNTLRSSGRFSWPLGYAIIIACIIFFYDYMQSRKKLAYAILTILFLFQIFDLSKMFYSIHQYYFKEQEVSTQWNSDLQSPFWYNISGKYQHLIIIDGSHEKFAYLAMLNNMTINMFSLSRIDQNTINLQRQITTNFINNNLQDNSLYIISSRVYAVRNTSVNQEQCKQIDGYIVCTKHW